MIKRSVFFIAFLMMFWACVQHETPKPRGFFRIALPEKSYQQFDSNFPYHFEHPQYSHFVPDTREWAEDWWGDLVFNDFNARIHISYKPVRNDSELEGYFNDVHTFLNRHIPKATAIRDEQIVYRERDVYGMLYNIRGREAASPLQFFATDSVSHFLRGALYFNTTPDNDSLAPVIEFLEQDIRHLLYTLEWQDAY